MKQKKLPLSCKAKQNSKSPLKKQLSKKVSKQEIQDKTNRTRKS